ncbi:MAG: haloacid dehalogenase type II [Balneolaceae bacterium]
MKPKALIFDVNETLLDLAPVHKSVTEALNGKSELVPLWFKSLLHLSLVYSAGGHFKPFGQLAADSLVAVARDKGMDISREDAATAIRPILSCPPHVDVIPGLKQLREKGFRLFTLTNSSSDALHTQMQNAGLSDLFDGHISVEEFGIYKPHRVVYKKAAEQVGIKPSVCMMIAAHDWDIMGAAWVGFQTAFITRGGRSYTHNSPLPDLIVSGIEKLCLELIADS